MTAPALRIGATQVEDPAAADALTELAVELPAAPPRFALRRDEAGLRLDDLDGSGGYLQLDFLGGSTGWRGASRDAPERGYSSRARSERVARACALSASGVATRVVDGTAGLGSDAWVLACAGAEVVAIERHPVLVQLLEDARKRALAVVPEVAGRLSFLCGELRTFASELEADTLYLDPMYAPRRKQALGDGRLRQLAALLVSDGFLPAQAGDDRPGLLEVALASPVPRVVLKRPRREAPHGDPPPGHTFGGRSTCFDVWFRAPSSPRA